MLSFFKNRKRINDIYFYVTEGQFKILELNHRLCLESRESEFIEERFSIKEPAFNTGDIILLLDAVWAATDIIYHQRKRQIVDKFFEANFLHDFAESDKAYILYLVSRSMIAENSGEILGSDRTRAETSDKPDLSDVNILLTNLFRTEPA